ncbi:MAG: penicillin acylase family protein [Chloroflexia bacterium]
MAANPTHAPGRRRPHPRLTATLAYGLPAAALAAAGAGLYRRLRHSLPPLDGTLFCPVSAPVHVRRDTWGIPHIHAESAADLFTAQGYVQAQDRLWQLDFQRRIGAGRLSEIFGPITLATDILLRRFGIRRAAELEASGLDEQTAAAVNAYCAGVNAYIAWAREAHALPAEFTVLAYDPEPWTPLDSVLWSKVMAWGLSGNWETELVRARLVNALGAERAARLEPSYPLGQPISAEPGTVFGGMDHLFADLLGEYEDLMQTTGLGGLVQSAIPASNGWAVGPARSESGSALLANDPHLPLTTPSVWHLEHLIGGEYDVAGATFPGTPGIVLGHNRHIAWGITNAMVDTQDLYVERLNPDDPTLVLYDGNWEQAEVRTERIRVRGRPRPVVETVLTTRHGPVIAGDWTPHGDGEWLHAGERLLNLPHPRRSKAEPSPTAGPHVALALRWTALAPGGSLRGLLNLNRAHDWASFRAAMRRWDAPAINMVYADTQGNFGYHLVGTLPVRERGQGALPVPGWTGEYEWNGTIPFDELPQKLNPASGYVVTANNRIVGPDYPYFLGHEWATGYRARRIADLIEEKPLLTLDDFVAIQADVYSIPGQALAELIVERLGGRADIRGRRGRVRRQALEYLAAWDGRMDRDSVGATLYEVTAHFLTREVYGLAFTDRRLLDQYLGSATQGVTQSTAYIARAVPQMLHALRENDLAWLRGLSDNPAKVAGLDWETLLERSLDQGLKLLRRRLGPDMRRWRWGRVHRLTLSHPLGSIGPLARVFNPPPVSMPGDRDTVCMSAEAPNSPLTAAGNSVSYRQLYDLGDWDTARVVLAGGQAGQPTSPHYADLLRLWRRNEYVPLPFSEEMAEAATASDLDLVSPAE